MWGEVIGANGSYEFREPRTAYRADFGLEKKDLSQKNAFYRNLSV
jgi:hypothetical protein